MGKTGSRNTSPQPRQKRPTRNLRGKEDGIPFGVQAQPTSEQKKAGWQKRKAKLAIRDLIKDLLEKGYNFKEDSQVKKQLESAFGNIGSFTVKELMVLQQYQKAILKGDTVAFREVINQAYGLPNQTLDITDKTFKVTVPDE